MWELEALLARRDQLEKSSVVSAMVSGQSTRFPQDGTSCTELKVRSKK